MARSEADRRIAHNVAAHDLVASTYDQGHPEIFNDVEQARLSAAVCEVLAAVGSQHDTPPRVLDVGAGTGNLTAHFLGAGATVVAADVSPECLRVVREKFAHTGRLTTQLLDGRTLSGLADCTFDVVACYSVLHHVPDYLALVADMGRVTRPGGVVYLDHERHDASWLTDPARDQFIREAVVWPAKRWTRFIKPATYWRRLKPLLSLRRWRDPRWMPEGDLHIWPDDHIEWVRVEETLAKVGVRPVIVRDYLLYETRYGSDAWERWRDRVTDYRMWIGSRA
jgi:2-polyprenyl-3-methyl-5-hydroxy-6-metoxy-1,4-benzoquinol methylase